MNDMGFEEFFKIMHRTSTANMYTAIPCRVVAVQNNLRRQVVDVQPLIEIYLQDGTTEEHPVILSVPVVLPGSSRSQVSFPVFVGDTVLCIFCQRGIDNFKIGTGQPLSSTDFRRFDKRDAVAIPGLFPFSRAVNNPDLRTRPHNTFDMVVSHNIGTAGETEIRLKESGDIEINSPTKLSVNVPDVQINTTTAEVNASTVEVSVGQTHFTGDVTIDGTLTVDGIVMNTHLHTGVTPGSGTSGGPVN